MTYEAVIKTYVTAIEITDNYLFAGIGNKLHVYNTISKDVSSYKFFQKQRIHGIRINEDQNKLVGYGNRELAVAFLNLSDLDIVVVGHIVVDDWIWDVKLRKEEIIVLSANNSVSLWKWKLKHNSEIAINCVNCLLYSGIIVGNKWRECIIIAGTMYKCILIWAPSVRIDEFCSVMHKLVGHTGAILSLFYHEKLKKLCSTSDDRSVRIWNVNMPENCTSFIDSWSRASIRLTITVYGHVSRVWKSIILDNGGLLTAGEDGQLRLWNDNGKPLHSWITHQGASIRSVSANEPENIIVTGGGDGGISLWPLPKVDSACTTEKMERIRFSNNFGLTKLQDIPRRIVLSRSGQLFTITNQGYLLCYNGSFWRCIVNNDRFADYCLLQISLNRRYISLASIRGDVMILRESNGGLIEIIYNKNICASKIFSFHWLDNYNFVTCCEQGRVEIWVLKNDDAIDTFNAHKIRQVILPACKERWLTSAVQVFNTIIVGDRDGSLHMYNNSKTLYPIRTYKRIHGRLGVSYIGDEDGKGNLVSVGRDGYFRSWRIGENELHLLSSDKLPIKWPVQVFRVRSYGLLVMGFNEVNFEVWDIGERKKLLTFACGGGHRPWDFFVNDDIRFVFIKKEVVYNVTLSANRLNVISFSKGFHTREIECLKCLKGSTFVSGGEDTTLRIFSMETVNQFKTVTVIRSHISSIKAISYLFVDDSILVVSVGGRAQINVYKIQTEPIITYEELASHMLKSEHKNRKFVDCTLSTLDLEPRHMDVHLHYRDNVIYIYCAGSDAFWRVFTFDPNTKSLQFHKDVEYANFCVLKIVLLSWATQEFVATFSSDGLVTLWDARTYTLVHQETLHQSSINSYDYVVSDNDQLLLVTGGDDAVIKFSTYKNGSNRICQTDCVSGVLHEANVTGVKIISRYIISASCDQKIILWEWSITDYQLRQLYFIRMYHSLIPDIRGFEMIRADEANVFICVYGVGFEILRVELK